MRLKNKTAVITGGGTGIGRATAILFAKEGAGVCIAGRTLKTLKETADIIQSEGGTVICLECDISKADEVRRMVDAALNKFGEIDILYNNAAVTTGLGKDIVELSEEEWDSLMSVNLKGYFLCSKYIIPHMIKNNGGVIINCSSISGLLGQRKMGAYNAAKGGIEVLTKCMALDFAQYKIRVNAISPAWVESVLNSENMKEEKEKEEILRLHPIGRIGKTEDIANAVLYLASDESAWVTGTSLIIDGGYMAQ
ncbi:MAG: SDR family oxidoreductase [Clostridiales bacterium]|nr:SDR family oxidoreductase [Clostridiales bacterium]